MRPVTNLPVSLFLSACLLVAGAWLAKVLSPESLAPDSSVSLANVPHDGLLVEIRGVRNASGHVIVTIYDDAEALARYDDENFADISAVPAAKGTVVADFPELTTGPYAITIFHDENDDLAFNMEGDLPLEGYGTSGARGPYDEPPFDRAAVPPGAVAVEMFYWE